MNRDNLSVIFRAAYGNEYVRVGRFRPEDRCSPSRRRVAQEQIETQVHARAISCAGYSVASTKRSTCAFNPSESSYPFCFPRAPFPSHCSGSPLNVWRKVSRWSRERKQQEETERRTECRKKEKAIERVDRESLIDFFEHLIGETEETKDRKEMTDEGQRDEAGRAKRKESLRFLPSFFCTFGSLQYPVLVLPR